MSAAILKMFGERGWSMFMGYGRRRAVETAFKRLYGEHTISRNIERELKGKSIHIQHTNKHTGKIRCDKQKKKNREVELGHKALFSALWLNF
jgi:hypothetical protein